MTQRISKLEHEGSAFSTLLKSFKKTEIRLSAEETQTVEGAITEVSSLRTNLKRKMAAARVIDLTSTQPAALKQDPISYQLTKAKDAVD